MSQQVKICPLRLLAQEYDCNIEDIYLGDSKLACLQERCAWFVTRWDLNVCALVDVADSLAILAEDTGNDPR